MKLREPQRVVDISPREEQAICQLTCQSYDGLLQLAAFGTPEKLSTCLAVPERFAEDRGSIILGVLDQVPVWVKIVQAKQLYRDHEVANNNKYGRRGLMLGPGKSFPQVEWSDGSDGLEQLRSHHAAAGDRYRVTVELCQLVTGYFEFCLIRTLSHQS